jgi:predicted house-cleaning noncanonical NTP pyrophosphatase (MazG superfamily)
MKLVRDKIPEIIYAKGEIACLSVVDDGEYHLLLRRKLEEEVQEYLESESAEELADILEVLYALASCTGLNEDELEQLRKAKADDRGRFLERIVWHGSRRLAGSAGDDHQESQTVQPIQHLSVVTLGRLAEESLGATDRSQDPSLFDLTKLIQPMTSESGSSSSRRVRRSPRATVLRGGVNVAGVQLRLWWGESISKDTVALATSGGGSFRISTANPTA